MMSDSGKDHRTIHRPHPTSKCERFKYLVKIDFEVPHRNRFSVPVQTQFSVRSQNRFSIPRSMTSAVPRSLTTEKTGNFSLGGFTKL